MAFSDNLILEKTYPTNELGTYSYTIVNPGIYYVSVQSTVVPPSGLQIQVKQNGTPKYTTQAPASTTPSFEFKVALNCAATDVIAVAITSSLSTPSIDQQLNTIKANILIGAGY